MKFEVEKDIFLSVIQKVQAVVERRKAVPLLSHVHLKLSGDQCEVIATDLDVGLKDIFPVKNAEDGSITVSAKKLFEVLKELPQDNVSFKVEENNWIEIDCGNANFKLVGSSDDEFPRLPEIDEVSFISVSAELLDLLTGKTAYAVSTDENRRVLTGVQFQVEKDSVRMVATDGHRLAFVEKPNEYELAPFSVILPQKAIHEIRRMISEEFQEISFGMTEKHIVFKAENEVVIARKIEGQFPDYKMVLPKDVVHSIKIDTTALNNSLRRVSLFSDLKARGVKLDFLEGTVKVTASTPEYGEAKDEIFLDYSGEPVTLGFNVNYLLDLLRTVDSEFIWVKVNQPSGPILFEPEIEDKEYTYLSIVMPMII